MVPIQSQCDSEELISWLPERHGFQVSTEDEQNIHNGKK